MREEKGTHIRSSLSRLLSRCFQQPLTSILAGSALLAASGINLLFPWVVQLSLSEMSGFSLFHHPVAAGTLLIGLFALQSIGFFLRAYFFGVLGQRVTLALRGEIFQKILSRPIADFDQNSPADLVSRLSNDTQLVQDAVGQRLSVVIRYAIQVMLGVGLMAYLSLQLTLVILLFLPVLVGIAVLLGKALKALTKRQQTQIGHSNEIAQDSLFAIRVVRAFAAESFACSRYREAIREVFHTGLQRVRVSAVLQSLVTFLMNGGLVAIFLYGVMLVQSQSLSLEHFVAFTLYGVIVAISFGFLSSGFGEFSQALGAADRIFELLDRAHLEEGRDPEVVNLRKASFQRGIAFHQVSFSYPTRCETEVLQKVSFYVPIGKMTALVGASGSGKSACIGLLMGFYQPSDGVITFDDQEASTLDPKSIRDRIAYVPQESLLFATSIRDNLLVGKNDASLEELQGICRELNLLSFIDSLPDGWDTLVGSQGGQISGGQRQRLCIARALLRTPDLLILDEATSSLDHENEKLVRQAIERRMKGKTVFIVAHQQNIVESADHVIVLEHGKVKG